MGEDMSWSEAGAAALSLAAETLPRTARLMARAAVLNDEAGGACDEALLLGDAYTKFMRAASDYCAAWNRRAIEEEVDR